MRPAQVLNSLFASALLAFCMLAFAAPDPGSSARRADGQMLFEGRQALQGAISGHASSLPAEASRCINCHTRRFDLSQPVSFGPILNESSLTLARARRAGPPSRYDAVSFCKVLRLGVDPAWVVIDTAMPRYQMSDAQCSALWSFLLSQK
jgi:hypothetical protein